MRGATLAISTVVALATSGCGGASPTSPSTQSTLNVMVTDSPFTDAQAVLITFSGVSAQLAGGDFVSLPFSRGMPSRTCDLKKLAGAQDILGAGPLPTGHYTQLRLIVSSATIFFDGPSFGPACADIIPGPAGRSAKASIPSGDVRLNHEFDVTTSGATTITLDVDGDGSMTLAGGQYIMNPVVNVLSVQ